MREYYLPNLWAVLGAVSLFLILCAEIAVRCGKAVHRKNPEKARDSDNPVLGAVLGLLGLLLGFSFAMAVGRHEDRRSLAIEEANAIGTTWLRADFLPDPYKAEAKDLLVCYTAIRLEKNAYSKGQEHVLDLIKKSEDIQTRLWAIAASAVKENPGPVTVSFVTTLNDTIDMQSKRIAARRNHVPGAVWLLLLIVSGAGAWFGAHAAGLRNNRSHAIQFFFPILIAVVITLISDMDRPDKGLVGVSQEPLKDLFESIRP